MAHILRRLLMCWWGGCGGHIKLDDMGVYWCCPRCGKITRALRDLSVRRRRSF